ncbi:MAG: tetratricopeptide repeat protein [Planctomycetota bacterium]
MTANRIYALLLPALLGFALFQSVLPGDFVYDDRSLISLNPTFQEWSVVGKSFTTPYWELVDGARFSSGFYRPVGASVLGIAWQLGGGEPLFFHMLSLFLHAACSLAVAALCLSIGWRPLLAGCAGVLFALSGVHAEPVAWISAIPELLATLFCLMGLRALALDKALPTALFLLLAMLSKEAAFGVWALALGITLVKRSWKPLVGLLVAGGVVYLLRWNAFDSAAAGFDRVNTHHALDQGEQFVLSLSLIGRYLGFLIWPWPHAPFHPLRVDEIGSAARLLPAILGGVVTLGAGIWWFWRGRSTPTVLFGLGLLFAGLVPVMNTNALGQYPFEERFLYLPSAGFVLLLAALLDRLSERVKKPIVLPIAVTLIAVPNAYSAWHGSRPWQDEESLFQWAQEQSPSAMTSHIEYGRLMLEFAQGTTDLLQRDMYTERALGAYRRSLEIDPDVVLVTSVEREKGNLGMGDALYLSGDFQAAESVYRQTVEHYRISPMGYLGLANCRGQNAMRHLQEGHPTLADIAFEKAIADFDTALEQSPGLLNAVIGKANALAQLGRFEEALPLAQDGFTRAPERLDVAQLLFTLHYQKQELDAARAVLQRFLQLNPEHPQTPIVRQTLEQMPRAEVRHPQ